MKLGGLHSTALALPGFHAFIGCANNSSIHRKGKNSCWDLWQLYPEFTVAFSVLSQIIASNDDNEEVFPVIIKYVARLFQLNDECQDVDSSYLHMFLYKGKPFEIMPPGSDVLKHHTHRAAYLHGHIWGKTLVPKISPLSPSERGWIINQLLIHVVQREFTEFPHAI